MNGFLLDTNVPSELTRLRSDPRVERWLDDADDELLFLSVVSLGEIFKGLTILPESKRRGELQQWIDETPESVWRSKRDRLQAGVKIV
jgi:predicted nucleic acid-binding protein